MFHLRDLPSFEVIQANTRRYPEIDPSAAHACLVMLRVASDVLAGLDAYWARQGMSQGRFTVLMLLNRDPERGINPCDLADRAGVTRATVTGLLDGLERDRLVARQGDAEDRRKLVIVLTARGRKYLDARLPDYFRRVATLMGHLTEAQRHALEELLGKVNEGTGAFTNPGGGEHDRLNRHTDRK